MHIISQRPVTVPSFFLYLYWKKRIKKKGAILRTSRLAPSVEVTLYQKQIIAGLLFSDGHLRDPHKDYSIVIKENIGLNLHLSLMF